MSSPPNYSTSPPYPAPLSLPKKRPSTSSTGPATKRRKPSNSSSSHPLRQTSFPPLEGPPGASRSPTYSPPVDDSLSVVGGRAARSVTGASSVGGGGRGRRGKGRGGNVDARSSVRGRSEMGDGKGSLVDGAGGGRGEEEDLDDEEGDGGEDAVLEGGGKEDEATLKMQREHLAMLVNAFNDDQMDRYNIWRRIKLKKETVRKLTNQTLSQSVSPNIIMVINGYTKTFIGELIERARQVQTEWLAAASPSIPSSSSSSSVAGNEDIKGDNHSGLSTHLVHQTNGHAQARAHATTTTSNNHHTTTAPSLDVKVKRETSPILILSSPPSPSAIPTTTSNPHIKSSPPPPPVSQSTTVEEMDRGPLTPDHLREAVRRYKKDREGGSAGFQGLSLQGKEGAATRVGGKRLFR